MEVPLTAPLLPTLPLETPTTYWSKCRKCKLVSALATTAGSITARVYSQMPAINALTSIGIGIGIQSTINTCFSNDSVLRVQQIALTICGQTSVFCLSYLWANFSGLQTAALIGIGVTLGVNGTMHAKHYIDKWFNRIDAAPSQDPQAAKFSSSCPTFITPNTPILHPFASVACLIGWFFTENTVAKGICSFGATFYAAQCFSQWVCNKVDEHLSKKKEKLNQMIGEFTKLPRSGLHVFKGIINSAAPMVIPLMWIPWAGDAQTPERSAQLWVVGLVTGLLDGFLWKSHENRFRNKAIKDLDELKDRIPEGKGFRIWRVAWAALVHVGIFSISLRELLSEKNQLKDKIAIGMMYTGFITSTVKNFVTDYLWNLNNRLKDLNPNCCTRFKDRLIIQQMLPRFLGVSPVYLYLLLTNSIAMRSGQDLSEFHQTLNCIAWYFFGKGMENEFHQLWGEKRGIVRFPMMAGVSAVLMTIKEIQGDLS